MGGSPRVGDLAPHAIGPRRPARVEALRLVGKVEGRDAHPHPPLEEDREVGARRGAGRLAAGEGGEQGQRGVILDIELVSRPVVVEDAHPLAEPPRPGRQIAIAETAERVCGGGALCDSAVDLVMALRRAAQELPGPPPAGSVLTPSAKT